MRTRHDLCREISLHQPEIIRQFNAATARPPWSRLPEEERINFLRDLIDPLVRLAFMTPQDPALRRTALLIAARHGERRHDQGLHEETLFQDLHYFGSAILTQLAVLDPETPLAETFNRIERLLSLASLASLRGYHRKVFEAQGKWPGTLDELGQMLDSYLH